MPIGEGGRGSMIPDSEARGYVRFCIIKCYQKIFFFLYVMTRTKYIPLLVIIALIMKNITRRSLESKNHMILISILHLQSNVTNRTK